MISIGVLLPYQMKGMVITPAYFEAYVYRDSQLIFELAVLYLRLFTGQTS